MPHEARCAPAEVVDVVVAQRPDRFKAALFLDVLDKSGVIRLRCRAENVRVGVFETEDELYVIVIDHRPELTGDVLCAGLMLAMNEGHLSPRLFFRSIEHALGSLMTRDQRAEA